MTVANPQFDLATHLQTGGHGTVGTSIFAGPVRASGGGIPEQAIFVREYGGPAPSMRFNGDSIYEFAVQVLVRAKRNETAGGMVRARAALAACHKATVSGYLWCTASQSSPVLMPQDSVELPTWVFNVRMMAQQP